MPKLTVTSRAIRTTAHTVRCPDCSDEVEAQGLADAPGGVRYQRHYRPGTQIECAASEQPVEKPP